MQVARYWRMKQHNYRLQGVRYTDGSMGLQARPTMREELPAMPEKAKALQREKISA